MSEPGPKNIQSHPDAETRAVTLVEAVVNRDVRAVEEVLAANADPFLTIKVVARSHSLSK